MGRRSIIVVAALALGVAAAVPFPAQAGIEDWQFTIAPYMWTPEVHGHIDTRDFSVPVDVDLHEVFDQIGAGDLFGLMGHFDVRYLRKYAFFVDVVHVWSKADGGRSGFDERTVSTESKNRTGIVTFGPAYRFLEMETRPDLDPLWVEGLIGGRVWWSNTEVDATLSTRLETSSVSRNVDISWAEPLFGLRWQVPLGLPGLNLNAEGDLGGFGVGSDLSWNAQAVFDYRLPWKLGLADVSLAAGYRATEFDRDTGSGAAERSTRLMFRGPLLGAVFVF